MLGDTAMTATPAAAAAAATAAVLIAALQSAVRGMLGFSTPCLVEPFCRSSASECAKKQMPRGHAAPLRHIRVLYLQHRHGQTRIGSSSRGAY
jgi:predicted transglutaminase-like cysteine proteinase